MNNSREQPLTFSTHTRGMTLNDGRVSALRGCWQRPLAAGNSAPTDKPASDTSPNMLGENDNVRLALGNREQAGTSRFAEQARHLSTEL